MRPIQLTAAHAGCVQGGSLAVPVAAGLQVLVRRLMLTKWCTSLLLVTVVPACTDSGGGKTDNPAVMRASQDAAEREPDVEDGDAAEPEPGVDAGDAPPPKADASAPSASSDWCWDQDGLPEELERAAGLDPCKDDSDDDGCTDRSEYLLGGCDDPRRTIFPPDCAGEREAVVRFTAPALAAGSWPVLELRSQAGAPFTIEARSSSEGSYGTGARFVEVPPGDELTFDFNVRHPLDGPAERFELTLVDQDGNKVEEGLLVVGAHECVILI